MDLYRLGVPVKVVGAAGLRSHDSRRWQNQPHLSVSLAYVRDIFEYLHSRQIRFYRLAGQLAPYITHPDLAQFHGQIEECSTELAATGDLARHYGIRLTMHPAFYVQLGSSDLTQVQHSIEELEAATGLMDAMGLGVESVLIVHVGGKQENKEVRIERFIQQVELLPSNVRRRLAIENDDRAIGVEDALRIHRHTGIRVVLDVLHHRCVNPDQLSMLDALTAALDSWPGDQRPKIHFSSPRTAVRHLVRNKQRILVAPLANQHSDFINPFEFIDLLRDARAAGLRPFDIMLEAKGKDLALLRLRQQIERFAPDLVGVVG